MEGKIKLQESGTLIQEIQQSRNHKQMQCNIMMYMLELKYIYFMGPSTETKPNSTSLESCNIGKCVEKPIGKDGRRYRYSGFNHLSPSERSQVIFSQVVIISPKEASTIVFPVSRDEILTK